MSNFSKIFIVVLAIIAAFYVKDNFLDKFDLFNKGVEKVEQVSETTPTVEEKQAQKAEKSPVKSNSVYVYFLSIDKEGNGIFKKVKRNANNNKKLDFAIKELLNGPNPEEKSQGAYNEIPKGTRLLSIKQNGNDVIIDLSSDFQYGGGTDSIYSRMRQLIKTALANAPKKNIYLYLDGKQVDVIGGEGIMVSQPLSENSLDD